MNQLTQTFANEVTINMTSSSILQEPDGSTDVMMIIHSIIAAVGIVGNLTVVVVFLNHKKFRRKIPNIFIINQVSENNLYIIHCKYLETHFSFV